MFTNTRSVFTEILKDLSKISFICFLIVQSLYITFLSSSLLLGSGILIVNIILLIASVAYLTLHIVSRKTDFENEKAIIKIGKTSYRRLKIATRIFTVLSMLYGFFIASEQQNSWSLVIMLATFLLCVIQILIECVIQFIENRIELLIDALKHDFAGVIKTVDFFKKAVGDKDSIWGDADKSNEELKEMKRIFKESEKEKKAMRSAERRYNRQERRAEIKTQFLAKFKKDTSA